MQDTYDFIQVTGVGWDNIEKTSEHLEDIHSLEAC
jgi:hypothetical protein